MLASCRALVCLDGVCYRKYLVPYLSRTDLTGADAHTLREIVYRSNFGPSLLYVRNI